MMLASEAAKAMRGTLIGLDRRFNGVSIDSRAISKDDVFFAIPGDKYDGHNFVDRALAGGAALTVVEKVADVAISQIKVSDSTIALGNLAKHWRTKFSIPVIGITGSNGKTTVTAMVRHIIGQSHLPLFPEQSYNNQWGVPLTLFKLKEHSHAVIEMGMNHPGEINYLSQIAEPTIALINNASAAHLEGLGDVEQVAMAKGEIIDALSMDGVVILNADDLFFNFWSRQADSRKIVSFGIENKADFSAKNIQLQPASCSFELHAYDESILIDLPLPGYHNVMNVLAAAAASHVAGVSLRDVRDGLLHIEAVSGRLTLMKSEAGANLIDDSFNANPSSMFAAIDVLSQCKGKKILVLGAMAELGDDSEKLHQETAVAAAKAGIDRLLYLNDSDNADLKGYQRGFANNGEEFKTVEALIAALSDDDHSNTAILVKGSKSSRMGRVISQLRKGNAERESASC